VAEPHEVLGVAPDASPEVVKAAHRALVKALHPDVAPTGARPGTVGLAEVNAAYDAWRAARQRSAEGLPANVVPEGGPARAMLVVDAFRPVAFEALVMAVTDAGDITDADEPFSLDVHVDGPPTGFCRIELLPEAGASLVIVESDQVDPRAVRDILVRSLVEAGVSTTAVDG
jgi:curved DNA-binding protein CbpA